MKLLITSDGISNPDLESALERLTGGRTDLRVSMIATAGDPIDWKPFEGSGRDYPVLKEVPAYESNPKETDSFKEWTARGFKNIRFVSLRDYPWVVKEGLENSDLIYISGGDVDYLLEWSKRADIKGYWKSLVESGVIVVTQSAGGGLLSTNVGFTYWEPNTIFDTVGYGVTDFSTIVHQSESDPGKSYDALTKRKQYLNENFPGGWNQKVYLLTDGQGILVDGDTTEHIGPGDKKVI